MLRLTILSLSILSSFPAVQAMAEDGGQAELAKTFVPGKIETRRVETKTGQVHREEHVVVPFPANAPAVVYTFTSRGATAARAVLQEPRYTRDPHSVLPGIPEEKVAGGPIDLVSTWDPSLLPFSTYFVDLQASEATLLLPSGFQANAALIGARHPMVAQVSPEVSTRKTASRGVGSKPSKRGYPSSPGAVARKKACCESAHRLPTAPSTIASPNSGAASPVYAPPRRLPRRRSPRSS
jgi:hypothetical protein